MAGRWMDDEREWRGRETRRSDPYGRDPRTERDYGADAYGDEGYRSQDYRGAGEFGPDRGARSFSPATGSYGGVASGRRQPLGPVFGETQTGADYRRADNARRDRGEDLGRGGRDPEPRYDAYSGGGRSEAGRGGEPRGDGLYREVYGYGARDDLSREPWEGHGARNEDHERRMRDERRFREERTLRDERAFGGSRAAPYERDERRDTGRNFLDRAAEQVSSWFRGDDSGPRDAGEDRRAERREEGLHRGRGPQAYKRPDERIADEVHERLTEDAWVDASNISVSVSGGEVTLSGTVPEREAKHRAERLIEDLSGVIHVQNNLRVSRGGFLTSPERGFGDSVQAAQMSQVEAEARPAGRRTDS